MHLCKYCRRQLAPNPKGRPRVVCARKGCQAAANRERVRKHRSSVLRAAKALSEAS